MKLILATTLLALTGCADRGECLEIFVGGVQVPMSFEVHVREEA